VPIHIEPLVIYDGECRFCAASLAWVKEKVQIDSVPYQDADLAHFDLSRDQCEKSVFVITDGEQLSGAAAIGYLLRLRGHTFQAWLIQTSGPIGEFGYRWVASHRNSMIIRIATKCLERSVAN